MRKLARWIAPALLALGGASFVASCSDAPAKQGGPRAPRATPVRAEAVEVGDLVLRQAYSGELIADAVDLAPYAVGRVAAVEFEVGDRVPAGAVVARLDPALLQQELRQAQATVRAARASQARVDARIAAARAELEAKEPLAARQLVSAQELAELRAELGALEAERAGALAEAERGSGSAGALQEQLRDLSLRAPWDAVVAARLLEPGATATTNTPVMRLVRAGPAEVRFRVPERDAALVRRDLRLAVRTQATGAERFAGRVLRMAGEISRSDRSLLVEGILDKEHEVLRPGMYATVELTSATLQDALLVPSAALLQRLGEEGLFVADEGKARWLPVEIRGEEAGVTAVQAELEPGQLVLVFGHDDLSNGSPIAVVGQAPEAAAAGGGS